MRRVVFNQKGGVGKSSITANLALALAQGGATVGLLDADVYGYSIPRMMGITRPAVAVDDLMMPVEAHGVRMMSIGFLIDVDGRKRLYIARGVGHNLKVRFNARPEVTVFELYRT